MVSELSKWNRLRDKHLPGQSTESNLSAEGQAAMRKATVNTMLAIREQLGVPSVSYDTLDHALFNDVS